MKVKTIVILKFIWSERLSEKVKYVFVIHAIKNILAIKYILISNWFLLCNSENENKIWFRLVAEIRMWYLLYRQLFLIVKQIHWLDFRFENNKWMEHQEAIQWSKMFSDWQVKQFLSLCFTFKSNWKIPQVHWGWLLAHVGPLRLSYGIGHSHVVCITLSTSSHEST